MILKILHIISPNASRPIRLARPSIAYAHTIYKSFVRFKFEEYGRKDPYLRKSDRGRPRIWTLQQVKLRISVEPR